MSEPTNENEGPTLPSVRRVTALVLDDDPDDIAIAARFLSRAPGYAVEVIGCVTLEEACEAVERAAIDIAFLDYDLRRWTGLEALESLREAGLEAPAILMTGMSREGLVLEAFHAGVADYLPKSAVSTSSLSRSMRNALEKADLERALRERNAELQATVDDLNRRQAEIQTFYHGLSHELKTPLTAAREFVSLVLESKAWEVPPRAAQLLETAQRSCDQMVVCLNDIVDASRLDTGKLELCRAETDLAGVVRDVVESFRKPAEAAGITLTSECAPHDTQIVIDRSRVYQILSNLIANAIKFTPPAGGVDVGVREDEDGLRITVHDTGRGIDAGDIDRIFDRLYQSRHEDAAVAGGLGMGLHICRELVHLHGGRIGVDSEPGAGSTFWFTLPRVSCGVTGGVR